MGLRQELFTGSMQLLLELRKLRESNKHGPGDLPSCTKTLCNQRGSWGLPLEDCVKQFLDACSDLINDAPDFFE